MVRIHPDPPEQGSGAPVADDRGRGRKQDGAVAQLGEHLLCKQGVVGSIPSSSTRIRQYRSSRTWRDAAAAGSTRTWQHLSVAVQDSGQRWRLGPVGSVESCSLFNNLEGKGSRGLMRVSWTKG